MKITLRKEASGAYSIYVPKKDLEARVVASEHPALWGGTVNLDNGWILALPVMEATTRLPITIEARLLDAGGAE